MIPFRGPVFFGGPRGMCSLAIGGVSAVKGEALGYSVWTDSDVYMFVWITNYFHLDLTS
jgi:hypothetical protein